MSYAFTLDASACTGCKACQEACKDKNSLPTGILWRRVIEVSGGEWLPRGSAWENNIFAYNLTVACNHCTHPKCAGVCPTDAYDVRPDGVVLLDASRCMGCGYCAWACPYSAPQFDLSRGVMTKCDFCADNLDAGLPPACVAACPLRVLDTCSLEDPEPIGGGQKLWQMPGATHPFPLPNFSRTEPHLVIKPHLAMHSALEKTVSNGEEILPPGSVEYMHGKSATRELPLVAFTLLAQMAAGLAICGVVFSPLPVTLMLSIGILLGVGGLISFLHLGRKRNAWRAVIHIRKSWLSREILMALLFGIAWLATISRQYTQGVSASPWPLAILGISLVYSMSCVYRLRAVPSWNTWRTQAAFFLSALILGALGLNLFIPRPGWVITAGLSMAAELVVLLTAKSGFTGFPGKLRVTFLVLSLFGAVRLSVFPMISGTWLAILVFASAIAAEGLGRWQFYAIRVPFPFRPV